MRKELENKSKLLSLVLRHKPQTIGLELDENGWASINQIITNSNITLPELLEIVETNEKKRFTLSPDSTMIQATQGHTIEVNLKLEKAIPTRTLYHGSKAQFLESIKKKGLDKGKRNHVHLSANIETAKEVANRRKGANVLFTVNCMAMYRDSIPFYKSENGVWLTDHVLPKYLTYQYF